MQTINLMPLIVESSVCRESHVKKLLSIPKNDMITINYIQKDDIYLEYIGKNTLRRNFHQYLDSFLKKYKKFQHQK